MAVHTNVFVNGPKDGTKERNLGGPIPSQRIPIYALANTGMTCDDEQVTKLEGHYDRVDITEQGLAYYFWQAAG